MQSSGWFWNDQLSGLIDCMLASEPLIDAFLLLCMKLREMDFRKERFKGLNVGVPICVLTTYLCPV